MAENLHPSTVKAALAGDQDAVAEVVKRMDPFIQRAIRTFRAKCAYIESKEKKT